MSILPLLCLLALFFIFSGKYFSSKRESFIASLTVCGLWIWIVTEALSPFKFINFWTIAFSWTLLLFISCFFLLRYKTPNANNVFQRLTRPSGIWDSIMFCGFLAILFGTFILALVCPPNTWDSLTYHMSRVAHWAQNGTVAPYPTNIDRQIFSSPWQEYAILHLYLLSGGDLWANMVQWTSMIGSLFTSSLIARELGASKRGQYLAAVITAAIPMGILQSNSTQGDYATAFWISAGVFWFLKWKVSPVWKSSFLCGVSLALACLTKSSGLVFAFPLFIWMAIVSGRSWSRWKQVLAVIVIVFVINAPFAARNLNVFGDTAPAWARKSIMNERLDAHILLANALRNMGTHVSTPFARVNEILTDGIYKFSRSINMELNDSRSTFSAYEFKIDKPSSCEDDAGNVFHFFLFAGLSLFCLLFARKENTFKFWLLLFSTALIFISLLKWQPWISRFHLPLFVLASGWAAALMEKDLFAKVKTIIVCVLILAALPYLINGWPRRLVGKKSVLLMPREERYFMQNRKGYEVYLGGVREIEKAIDHGCFNIGLFITSDMWEYPLFPLLKNRGLDGIRLEHVNVDGPLANIPYPLGDFKPCLIIDR